MNRYRVEIFGKVLGVILVGIVCLDAEADTARGYMKEGLEQMEEEQYLPAATNFQAAAELAAGQDRDPARARFNAGNAFYSAQKWEDARASYNQALQSEDIGLQAKVYYNLGNIDLKQAEAALKENKANEAVELYDQARDRHEKAITLAPDFMDPKLNYEIAGRRKHELLAQVDVLRSDIKKAKEMIDEYEYGDAVRFMQEQKPEHELAFQLEPKLKKNYEELLERTTQVARIELEAEKGGKEIQNIEQ